MLKREIGRRWSDVELIDIFKEVDLRLNFTAAFRTTASREVLDPALLQRRLLLCLFGIGTNVGLKCVASQQPGVTVEELRYVKRRFVQKDGKTRNGNLRTLKRQPPRLGPEGCSDRRGWRTR